MQKNYLDILSLNHHFRGDVSAWFYTYLAGMRINPTNRDVNEVEISPLFPSDMSRVKAGHRLPSGELRVAWTGTEDEIELVVSKPQAVYGRIVLPNGWVFAEGGAVTALQSGTYTLHKQKN